MKQRQGGNTVRYFEACSKGDLRALRGLLANDPGLARATNPEAANAGWTGLHAAAQNGHVDAVRLLLVRGADPNAREDGDNTYPLHWAAAVAHLEIVRALLDAGGDVHGAGDLHELDVIGWAALFQGREEDNTRLTGPRRDVVSLLVERGARHHIFSAIATGDPDTVRALVERDPRALDRRLSRFEQMLTPLHFAMNRKRYDMVDLLIELGAALEAEDQNGRTALAAAMLAGDREAMRRLAAAGAKRPKPVDTSGFRTRMTELAASVTKGVPTIRVADIARSLDWYTSIGFEEVGRYTDGAVVWGMVRFGKAEVAFDVGGKAGPHDVSLWFETGRIDPLYELLRSRQLEAAEAALAGRPADGEGIEFAEDLYEPFYGGRQFSIRDPDGYHLVFLQPEED